jgi:hypothetical protein
MGRYDAISFVPPRGVRTACARGIALHEQGHGGDGLQPETVAWARRIARGEAVSPEKATKMNAWFARHATSPGEAEARRTDKRSPAWVAWLLWGGNAGRRWARRLVRQMNAADKRARSREMAMTYGACIALGVLPTDAEGGPWTTIAYETELKGYRLADGTYARITATDIDQMVANFAHYPKSPMVVEHADTRKEMPAEWAVPRGHVVALRRGTFTRTLPDGTTKEVASLEAKFAVSPEVRLSIVGDPANGVPPTWPFCSITTARGINEETGASIGCVLYSVSLTAHPRLADLPCLAASKDPQGDGAELGYWYGEIKTRGDVIAMLRSIFEFPVMASEADVLTGLTRVEGLLGTDEDTSGVDVDDLVSAIRRALGLDALKTGAEVCAAAREALRTLPAAEGQPPAEMSRGAHAPVTRPKEGTIMKTFLELAAALKLTAVASEDDAHRAVLSLAQDGHAARTTLGLAADAPIAPALADVVTARAELAKLTPEITALRTEKAARDEAELSRRVDEVCLSRGFGDEVKPALVAFAKSDRKAFDEKFPAPSVQELAQRAQDSARTETVAGQGAGGAAQGAKAADPAKTQTAAEAVSALVAVYAEHGAPITRVEALRAHLAGETAEKARAAFAQGVAR